jgi:hypothetical protein
LLTQSVDCFGEELPKAVFVFENFRREVFPQWLDYVQRRRIRRNENELDAAFVGLLLPEFRVMGAVVMAADRYRSAGELNYHRSRSTRVSS